MLQGVACGSGKLYLCFWVTKLVAVSVYKQFNKSQQFLIWWGIPTTTMTYLP